MRSQDGGIPARRPSPAFLLNSRYVPQAFAVLPASSRAPRHMPAATMTAVPTAPWRGGPFWRKLGGMPDLSHFDEQGASRMVDVGQKPVTERVARAAGRISMQPATLQRIRDRDLSKGDVLGVARLAGIMAAKRTAELIPLCHSLSLTSVELVFDDDTPNTLRIEATVRNQGPTGVEMEALTAVAVAALTVYDMCKSVDRQMTIEQIRLEEKWGGASGHFRRGDGNAA